MTSDPPEENTPAKKTTGTAVWYFVGATFLFASTTFLHGKPGIEPLIYIALACGFVVLIAGMVVFSRELRAK